MPAASSTAEEQNEADQKMWTALKKYITKERQRKKEGNYSLIASQRSFLNKFNDFVLFLTIGDYNDVFFTCHQMKLYPVRPYQENIL